MEFVKFMYKFNDKMLPESFNNYFAKLDDVHKYKTRQKHRKEFFQFYIASKTGKKSLRHICINVWKNVPTEYRQCSSFKFKRYFKSNALLKYYIIPACLSKKIFNSSVFIYLFIFFCLLYG